MNRFYLFVTFMVFILGCSSCNSSQPSNDGGGTFQASSDSDLAEFIHKIRAVDDHAHPNTIDPNDAGADALPLEGLGPIELPARVRPGSETWVAAYEALYGFKGTELNESTLNALKGTVDSVEKVKGENFPGWVLDECGIEVMLANRLGMGSGLSNDRFRWVVYTDALLFPLSTAGEAAVTPDREKLYPMEARHLQEFLESLKISRIPVTLDKYLQQVVTPTLEKQQKAGCVAVKFEAAYLRSLDFEKGGPDPAAKIYSRYARGGTPSHADYKIVEDYIFYYIAREAGRLGLAVHIHDFPGVGNFFVAAGSDPLLLEPVFNDPELRKTNFVLIHGGGPFSNHSSAMLWKPNVYIDLSLLSQLWTPDQLAIVLREYLSQFPEKVLFGTDAVSFGPGFGWELGAWIATSTGRQALTIALTRMVRNDEFSRQRAMEIATMVMRTNANNLYHLGLH